MPIKQPHETEDIIKVERYGSYLLRFSTLSEKWCLFESTILVAQNDEIGPMRKLAKKLSGYEDQAEDLFIPIPPLMTDLSRLTLSPSITAGLTDLSAGTSSLDNLPGGTGGESMDDMGGEIPVGGGGVPMGGGGMSDTGMDTGIDSLGGDASTDAVPEEPIGDEPATPEPASSSPAPAPAPVP